MKNYFEYKNVWQKLFCQLFHKQHTESMDLVVQTDSGVIYGTSKFCKKCKKESFIKK